MDTLTFEQEQSRRFDKNRAIKLLDELISFLSVLQEFCDNNKTQQPLDAVSTVLTHIRKIANRAQAEVSLIE